jgi:UDP-N-acetylglucosamine diphosphorylase/glucosamine-1-phosphate N-acetyltransferase
MFQSEHETKSEQPMMNANIILFDDEKRDSLLPLVYTRPVCELRIGILTIREKWERYLKGKASYITQDYLAGKYPIHISEDNIVINGAVSPSHMLYRLVSELDFNEALLKGDDLIAARLDAEQFQRLMNDEEVESLKGFDLEDTPFIRIEKPYDIFSYNEQALQEDFDLITRNRASQAISNTNTIIGNPDHIFLEKGAKVECAILNASKGPIYVGSNAEIMEGAMVRGGLAMCEGAVLKMGAKIYGATTLGPYCKVGGEVSNVVFLGYSNKGHDGYLGNAVIGEWCNIGADSNNSNLKNNYTQVKLWDYPSGKFKRTGLQFCGLIMGDHSKCGINTMFNTGTVIGVNANIYGTGFPRNFVPSFAWGSTSGYMTFLLPKVYDTARTMMARRGIELTEQDQKIMEHVMEISKEYRAWEKA